MEVIGMGTRGSIEGGFFGWLRDTFPSSKRDVIRLQLSKKDPNFKDLPKREQEKIISKEIESLKWHPRATS
jgi:hypothetical protein